MRLRAGMPTLRTLNVCENSIGISRSSIAGERPVRPPPGRGGESRRLVVEDVWRIGARRPAAAQQRPGGRRQPGR